MQLDISDMEAEVYTKNDKGVYYVKVSFPSVGMYINSITVRPSSKYPGGLWVQMPAIKLGRWIHVIEFKNGSQLQDLIRDAALRAVDAHNRDSILPDIELEDMDDEALGKQMDETLQENNGFP
jgi:hypothetical protein